MSFTVLLRLSFAQTILLIVPLQLLGLFLLYTQSENIIIPDYATTIVVGCSAVAVLFALLLRAPQKTFLQSARYEIIAFITLVFITVMSIEVIKLLYDFGQSFRPLTAQERQIFGEWNWSAFLYAVYELILVSTMFFFVVFRLFARGYSVWRRLRRRHLVWEITHVQLRLLLIIVLGVFVPIGLWQYTFVLPLFASADRGFIFFTWLIGLLGVAITLYILLIVPILLPASVVSYATARRLIQRVNALVIASQDIHAGRYDVKVEVTGEDELTQLQKNFNAMAGQLFATTQDLKSERDRVAELLASRTRLFMDISHELRTPITSMHSYLQAKRQEELSSQDVYMLMGELLRMQQLLEDIFTIAQNDTNRLKYTIAPIDLVPIVQRIVGVGETLAWQRARIEMLLQAVPERAMVMADAQRVEQIMHNLLSNAIKHTMPGGLIVVRMIREMDFIRVDVEDTGIGISDEDLPHIWERFYRANHGKSEYLLGTGLGLALVKELTESMHGKVAVRSKVNEGTCFSIWLPAVE
ncbi:MAG: hypothetical protein OHK0046_48390 [Anaerolineae bacterium]